VFCVTEMKRLLVSGEKLLVCRIWGKGSKFSSNCPVLMLLFSVCPASTCVSIYVQISMSLLCWIVSRILVLAS
jgi:hypothetical protein